MRLHIPAPYLLCFFPACFGFLLSNPNASEWWLLPLFFIGSIIVRGAGCVINDIFDRNFDPHVQRTKNRPLANKSLSVKEALITLFVLLLIGLSILLMLSKTAIYLGFGALVLIVLYPLMKRITHFPQIFMGFTFTFGSLIGFASASDHITLAAMLLYLGGAAWAASYDTIYGFMDYKDDKKIGVKSTALFYEKKNYRGFIIGGYLIFILLFVLANFLTFPTLNLPIFIGGVVIASSGLAWQVKTLDITNPNNCLVRFKSNVLVGAILSLAMLVLL